MTKPDGPPVVEACVKHGMHGVGKQFLAFATLIGSSAARSSAQATKPARALERGRDSTAIELCGEYVLIDDR